MKLNQKVSGVYFTHLFTGKVIELEEGIRYNHQNNCIRVKVELEDPIRVLPGCEARDCITLVLSSDSLELEGNKINKEIKC
jgi:hypothetical protein